MKKFLKKMFDPGEKTLQRYARMTGNVTLLEDKVAGLSDEQLKQKTAEFKERVKRGEKLDHLMQETFAVVREASRRVLGLRHYDVQLMGAMALHDGSIAEMKTGEGKTLASTLAVYLNALSGQGVHVVTANEYLAERDAKEMGELYSFLGLTTGLNHSRLNREEKKKSYLCDVIYGTASEFGFDYLRDNMAGSLEEKVQRPLSFAIVDEVDSILVDEARTPLIISGQVREEIQQYQQAHTFARSLKDEDYTYDLETKNVSLTEAGVQKAEKWFKVPNLYEYEQVSLAHHVDLALRARVVMQKDVDYMVQGGEVRIIDPFTGRVMEGRRFSDGLHQALEAKEGVKIEKESKTLATVTIQNYFRMYSKLAGMTGTAKTEEEEFLKIYNMPVVEIPTNVPVQRTDHEDLIYMSKDAKYRALLKEIQSLHKKGQPILVGTISVETSELVSEMLKKKGIRHRVLNAKHHEKEADIIKEAGEKGAVTIATNMAGRGTDIKLGLGVADIGGLAVIGTEKHESRRIDNQLRGRSGRQGDPGMSRFYLSVEDELMLRFGGENLKKTMKTFRLDEDEPLESRMVTKTIESSQKRVEGNHFDMRKRLLEYDDVIRQQRETIYRQRDQVLIKEDCKELSFSFVKDHLHTLIARYTSSDAEEEWDLKGLYEHLSTQLIGANDFAPSDFMDKTRKEIGDYLWEYVVSYYEEREKVFTSETMRDLEKALILKAVDDNWIDHIDAMSRLREGIHLRAYAQTDPLREYQFEGYRMYEEMLGRIREHYSKMILLIEKDAAPEPEAVRTNVGRNEPCPCGSGKKYKKCHGS